ncbi:hypothetical protein [Adlercreutzia caecimuris]|uniref:Uncharacterized protein n=1 Tax=Adlercreutzia caecimuris TaxID=671266 RepID=A0A4S4G0C4_9ACTN|nr:hypothetical protein [Adlercreutzia caecimuris]THG36860.1 hypothetical protein E5986_08135 [Adlercreutzia caecimuris]
MSRLVVYGPCLDCAFREFGEASVMRRDPDLPAEFGLTRCVETQCLKVPVCKLVEGLEPIRWKEGE